jgi:hypothetical protein
MPRAKLCLSHDGSQKGASSAGSGMALHAATTQLSSVACALAEAVHCSCGGAQQRATENSLAATATPFLPPSRTAAARCGSMRCWARAARCSGEPGLPAALQRGLGQDLRLQLGSAVCEAGGTNRPGPCAAHPVAPRGAPPLPLTPIRSPPALLQVPPAPGGAGRRLLRRAQVGQQRLRLIRLRGGLLPVGGCLPCSWLACLPLSPLVGAGGGCRAAPTRARQAGWPLGLVLAVRLQGAAAGALPGRGLGSAFCAACMPRGPGMAATAPMPRCAPRTRPPC